ncbi:putative lupus La protein [Helianthus annuus]|uniref:Lupus La protein n=1 Tax=Helianthus annuus TaxID=4232 RepID=A0A251TM69_HELAN|nr:la-related protein 6C [Helianthus annuus]KAF5787029.1 putative lupus La protein [Helianthus annuus]KAJ0514339.1 putative lupus La protein [Helianthus annuus]KAJ0522492.1 putative lupus La protein [Helianthus annuus]KAJ0530484.1 putative lupus La protein [Helianthus annuus]KAJ0697336.1 putative lupus La protein [Helianthus annuus]
MAQAHPDDHLQEKPNKETTKRDEKREISSFKFNAQAPEFVPSSRTPQSPVSGYFYPCFGYMGMGGNDGSGSGDWIYAAAGDQDQQMHVFASPNVMLTNCSKNVLTQDLQQKIIKQVEYQFSGLSLLANESLVKHISKDPEGYVPISVIASMKKIKSCITNNNLLAQALRSSSKLVVSNDGKKVRRKHPFTEKDKEELQSRTVVGENLPEDHSHQNLEKIFSVVGSVKAIRICHPQPQEPNSSHAKGGYVFSNKLHALVEYETAEVAEKAVDKLNDERNWRKGFRVRLLIRRSPKSVLKTRKSDFDGLLDEDDDFDWSEESSQPNSATSEPAIDNNIQENSKKGWARGCGKSKSRTPTHGTCGLLAPSLHTSSSAHLEASPTKSPKGPRMPDGTRGFTMGRGKPILTGIP